jgi:hypothetical protein
MMRKVALKNRGGSYHKKNPAQIPQRGFRRWVYVREQEPIHLIMANGAGYKRKSKSERYLEEMPLGIFHP